MIGSLGLMCIGTRWWRVSSCSTAGRWRSTRQSFSTTVAGVGQLGEWLAEREVELVVMEATGVYWRPVFYGLEDRFGELWLVNAHHVKNVPGRKTRHVRRRVVG